MNSKPELGIVVLAAGRGTRMRSDRAKVLHGIAGKPFIVSVLDTALALRPARLAVVVGHEAEEVERATEQWDAHILTKLGDADARALAEIVSAIRRIDGGTFGRCYRCGDRIPSARIEAVPTTRRCIDCATLIAKRAAVYAR